MMLQAKNKNQGDIENFKSLMIGSHSRFHCND